MLDLAKVISDDIEIVGKRPGEKTDEDLISEREISRTFIYGDDIHIRTEKNEEENKLSEPYNSASAEKMTTEEIEKLVWGY
jgi:FlaA1/EpsC-like NDP-sugar epimerase